MDGSYDVCFLGWFVVLFLTPNELRLDHWLIDSQQIDFWIRTAGSRQSSPLTMGKSASYVRGKSAAKRFPFAGRSNTARPPRCWSREAASSPGRGKLPRPPTGRLVP